MELMKNEVEFIAFDADDTLWENELYFQEFEKAFCRLLIQYLPDSEASQELFKTEMKNLHIYGYGLKSMMLSMIETICRVTNGDVNGHWISEIIKQGQELLQRPIKLWDGVEEVLSQLSEKYVLVLATKGDLFDQKRKISNSGLQDYFSHIEIMSDKKTADYSKLFATLNCSSQQFMMIGNSINSDIIPVLELGGHAAHIPYHITWQHEQFEGEIDHPRFIRLNNIRDLLKELL